MEFEKAVYAIVAVVVTAFLYPHFRWYFSSSRPTGRAPRVRYYLPYGLDMLWEAYSYGSRNENYKLILKNLSETKSNTYEMQMPGFKIIVTVEPENIKAILATQFQDFGKGQVFHESWKEFLGDGIFNVDGQKWSEHRALLRPQFVKNRVSDLQKFEVHINKLVQLIPKNGETFDIMDLWHRFTLDASSDYLFGLSVGSLDNPKESFGEAFATIQETQITRFRFGALWWLYYNSSFAPSIKILNNFVDSFIERTLSQQSHTEATNFTEDLAEFTQDRKVLRDQLVNLLLAGRDTTAAALSWLFYELAYHPDVYVKLRKEVLDVLGPDREPTYQDLKGMKYMQNCLNEVLRLYPSVPLNGRRAFTNTTLPRGGGPLGQDPILITKDTLCLYSPLVMQRREDLFGPTANNFDPSRWDTWTPLPWTYVPFNGGPRICLGQNFALIEIAYAAARICQLYEKIEERSGKARGSHGYCEGIILTPLQGVKIGLIPAENHY